MEESKPDSVKLAFERARKYKKSLQLDKSQEISKDPVGESAEIVSENGGLVSGDEDGESMEVPEAVRIALEKAGEYQQNKGMAGNGKTNVENENMSGELEGGEKDIPEAVRRAMEKAKEYQKNKGVMSNGRSTVESENVPEYGEGGREVVPDAVGFALEKAEEYDKVGVDKSNEEIEQLRGDVRGGDMEVPDAVRLAMGKAKEYKKNKGTIDSSSNIKENSKLTGSKGGSASNLRSGSIEQNAEKKGDRRISGIDFVGLNFADKKKGRGLPAGLVPVADPFPVDDLPEVEILVGDASKFGNAASTESKTSSQEESSELYKPKVTTWGVFPRPNNISKTFGGGRNIRPGEALETPEDRAAKEARTRQLIAAYNRKMGLNMDPKLKAECEKSFRH